MAKDHAELVEQILEGVGGEENVSQVFHCATRLRFKLNDRSKLNVQTLEAIPEALGTVDDASGIQVVIGNDVSHVFTEMVKNHPALAEGTTDTDSSASTISKTANPFTRLLNVLSAIVGPVIPIIMCSGLISAMLVILTRWGGLDPSSSTYTIINMVGTGALYFLPIMVAYTSAKHFGCDPMISLFLGALLISPTLIDLIKQGDFVSLFVLPVKTGDYTSSLIPAILTIWLYAYVERFVNRIVPEAVRFVFRPLVSLIIMIPAALCVTAPLGNYVGLLLMNLMRVINSAAPWASVLVIGFLAPILVLTGTHLALIPLVMMQFSTIGFDNLLFPAFIGMNFSTFGVALACFFKSRNPNLKTLSLSCAVTAFFAGVTEPTLYGICVRMKRPLFAVWVACAVNAIFCAVFGVVVYQFGAPSFFTMPIFLNPDGSTANLYFAIVAAVITIVVAFVVTWLLGFDDSIYGDAEPTAKEV